MQILKKEINSLSYAINGIFFALRTQVNFLIQIFAGLLSIFLAYLVNFSGVEWIILLILICLVLSAELGNTVVEQMVDLSTDTVNNRAKIVKDLSAGIVLLVSTFVFIVGLILFIPHLLPLLMPR